MGEPVKITQTVAGMKMHVVVDDDTHDLSWLDQTDDEMGEGFEAEATKRKEAYERGDWTMVGVYVTLHDEQGQEIARSRGLWSIESDSGQTYLRSAAQEEVRELSSEYGVDLSALPLDE